MSRITERAAVAPLALFNQATSSATGTGYLDASAVTYLGQIYDTSDGREVVLVSNGATALTSGKLVQSSAQVTAFQKLAMTVPTATPATAGTNQILVTNGATVLNVNQFAGGYLITASGTGLGQTLKISSHQPAAASATFLVTLEDPIVTTLDATTTVSLIASPYANVIINPATASGLPIGVTLYPLAASVANTYNGTSGALATTGTVQYGLIVKKGVTGCLIDTLTNVGYPVGRSASVAGAVSVATLTTAAQVGISAQTQTDTQYGMININL